MHGELMFDAPSFANDVHRRTRTLLYIIGTFTEYASASRCACGSSGISAGISALLHASITLAARTPWSLPSRRYAMRTPLARSTLLRVAERAPPEVRGRQPRDAAADDDEVVVLAGVGVDRGKLAERAAAH